MTNSLHRKGLNISQYNLHVFSYLCLFTVIFLLFEFTGISIPASAEYEQNRVKTDDSIPLPDMLGDNSIVHSTDVNPLSQDDESRTDLSQPITTINDGLERDDVSAVVVDNNADKDVDLSGADTLTQSILANAGGQNNSIDFVKPPLLRQSRMIARRHNDHVHITEAPDPDRVIQHGSHTHTQAENEANSGWIFLVMIAVILSCQAGLMMWKKYSVKSFDACALTGLWIIPIIWSIYGGAIRMAIIWLAYSLTAAWVMQRAFHKPVSRTTPRLVYQFFYLVYRVCYGLALVGYVALMSDFTGVSFLLPSFLTPTAPIGFTLLFYGLYYGVVSRDLAQVCSESLAVNLGYIPSEGGMPSKSLPTNTCALCDHQLYKSIRLTDKSIDDEKEEKVFTLNCGHCFHEFCIRGWTLIGKRDSCPYCKEKVRLRTLFKNPWETQSVAWSVLLDAIRYLIVFNPIILLLSQGILYLLY